MDKKKAQQQILFTGGSGLLGSEFKKILPNIHYPSSKEFNLLNLAQMDRFLKNNSIKICIHTAAFTSPPKIEKDPIKAIDVNIIGTANIVKLCIKYKIRLIYISTDYIFKGDRGNYAEEDPVLPINKYAWSKLGGECCVQQHDNFLIIRTSFGSEIFPYKKAFIDQWTSRERVTTISQKIIPLIDTKIKGIIHIGGDRKTVFEYANSLKNSSNILQCSVQEAGFTVPHDTSLNCSRYEQIISNV